MGSLSERLADLVKKERELAAQVKSMEAQQKALRELIKDEMVMEKVETVDSAGFKLTMISPKPSEKLVVGKLIAAGVTPTQIEAGTVVTPRASYVKLTKIKSDDQEG